MEEVFKEIKLIKEQLIEHSRKISELQEQRIAHLNDNGVRPMGFGYPNNQFEDDSVPSSSRVIGNEIALSQFSTSLG